MSQRLLILITIALILGLGVFWFSQHKAVAPTAPPVSQQPANSNQAKSKTLDDLLAQAEETELPQVNTTGWQSYLDQKLGIEYMYPKGWVVKEHYGDLLCVETVDNHYAKMPGSVAQAGQGDECIVQINEYQADKISFSNEWMKQNIDSSFSKAITQNQNRLLLIKDSSMNYVYMKVQKKVFYLRVWDENLAIDRVIPDVFYGILQTLKPIQK